MKISSLFICGWHWTQVLSYSIKHAYLLSYVFGAHTVFSNIYGGYNTKIKVYLTLISSGVMLFFTCKWYPFFQSIFIIIYYILIHFSTFSYLYIIFSIIFTCKSPLFSLHSHVSSSSSQEGFLNFCVFSLNITLFSFLSAHQPG